MSSADCSPRSRLLLALAHVHPTGHPRPGTARTGDRRHAVPGRVRRLRLRRSDGGDRARLDGVLQRAERGPGGPRDRTARRGLPGAGTCRSSTSSSARTTGTSATCPTGTGRGSARSNGSRESRTSSGPGTTPTASGTSSRRHPRTRSSRRRRSVPSPRRRIDETLRGMAIEQLLVTGIATNCCVSTTVRDAADLGYERRPRRGVHCGLRPRDARDGDQGPLLQLRAGRAHRGRGSGRGRRAGDGLERAERQLSEAPVPLDGRVVPVVRPAGTEATRPLRILERRVERRTPGRTASRPSSANRSFSSRIGAVELAGSCRSAPARRARRGGRASVPRATIARRFGDGGRESLAVHEVVDAALDDEDVGADARPRRGERRFAAVCSRSTPWLRNSMPGLARAAQYGHELRSSRRSPMLARTRGIGIPERRPRGDGVAEAGDDRHARNSAVRSSSTVPSPFSATR